MQDWAFEVADPSELDKYLSLFSEVKNDEDVRFTLADVIIQAFAELESDFGNDPRWIAFLAELERNLSVHASQIWYWAFLENDIEDGWPVVSPIMRSLIEKLD